MITAHAPSGYILARLGKKHGIIMWAALLGAVFPDIDLIWFYLIDARAFHHHRYWVHIPAFWAIVALIALPILRRLAPRFFLPALSFLLAIFLHICLDSIAGDILWGWPFYDYFTHLVTVPATHKNWILNFILHPVFVLELGIWGVAIYLWTTPK